MSEGTDEKDLASAIAHAEHTRDRFLSSIPKELHKREDSLLDRFRGTRADPIQQLAMLYLFTDELHSQSRKFSPCKKGCTSCCHYKVDVHEVEVAYIEKHAGYQRLDIPPARNDFHGSACPFLANGECTIYSARPLRCRLHVVFTKTAYWCDPTRSNAPEATGFSFVGFSEVNKALKLIATRAGNSAVFDIRHSFGFAQL